MSNNKTIIQVKRNPNMITDRYESHTEEAQVETYRLYKPSDLSFFEPKLKEYQQVNEQILTLLATYKPTLKVKLLSYTVDECTNYLTYFEQVGQLEDLTITYNNKTFIKIDDVISEFEYIQILNVGIYSPKRQPIKYLVTKEGLVPQV